MKTLEEPKKLHKDEHLSFDVVCGMDVVEERAKCTARYGGITYYFYSSHCRQHFENTPDRYVWER